MKKYFIYMTAKDASEARKLGRVLLKDRLAACVNILGPIASMYWWKDAVQNDKEVALIAKTTARNLDPLIRKVRSIHSYDVPCVVALPIAKGNPAFLQWIERETENHLRRTVATALRVVKAPLRMGRLQERKIGRDVSRTVPNSQSLRRPSKPARIR